MLEFKADMRRGSEKKWWVVPCRSKKYVRTESQMTIEEILRAKLTTIEEVPEMYEEYGTRAKHRCMMIKKGKKNHLKVKMGHFFTPQFSLKDSYVLFVSGFSSKRSLADSTVVPK